MKLHEDCAIRKSCKQVINNEAKVTGTNCQTYGSWVQKWTQLLDSTSRTRCAGNQASLVTRISFRDDKEILGPLNNDNYFWILKVFTD